jgi:hypothetical protein
MAVSQQINGSIDSHGTEIRSPIPSPMATTLSEKNENDMEINIPDEIGMKFRIRINLMRNRIWTNWCFFFGIFHRSSKYNADIRVNCRKWPLFLPDMIGSNLQIFFDIKSVFFKHAIGGSYDLLIDLNRSLEIW